MEKKRVDALGVELSRLGMGLMRLPLKNGEIDDDAGFRMVDSLLASGVNYFDTAWFYHHGKSEAFVKRALTDRHPRGSFHLATKLPLGELASAGDAERLFDNQRRRTGLELIDFYLLHGIGETGWEKAKRIGAHEMQHRLKREGKIRFAGFSFHGAAKEIEPILNEGDWDFVMMQLNYYDWLRGDARDIYESIAGRGLALMAMEPVRGGGLARLPAGVERVVARIPGSPAQTALRWVADLPGVTVVLSGMSTPAQAEENIALFSARKPLSDDEREIIADGVRAIDAIPSIACTGCKYCIDCPQGIDIPELFSGYNNYTRFADTWTLKETYLKDTPEEKRIPSCVECGACEDICPQKLPVITELKKVHELAVGLP